MSLANWTRSTARPSGKQLSGEATHFYLPDLCNMQVLLPLILVGALLSIVLTLADSKLPYFNWGQFSLLSLEILWIVLCGAITLCRLRQKLLSMSAASGVLLCFIALMLIISLIAAAGQLMLGQLKSDWHESFWIVVQHITVGGILSGLALRYFYLQQQLHLQQQAQLRTQMQARFQSLQSRIRPHFLFNSMNIIASLIDSDPETAEKVVEDLSALFRASLGDVGDRVPLSQELSLCERYIHIEQLRLGERLRVQWHKHLQHDHHPVPSLCLQPLLENAIYHGIQPLVGGGVIDISLSDDHDRLTVVISNPFTAETANLNKNRGNGMALDNLEQRLRAGYGDAAEFAVQVTNGQQGERQFVVTFSLPTVQVTSQATTGDGR
ncbi:MAG TPA: histidine kinase [Pseudomonadales bacterium]|nr:histidine kinase [Pseudomonadales bacterium]